LREDFDAAGRFTACRQFHFCALTSLTRAIVERRAPAARGRVCRGFTLIELMTVLIIIALLVLLLIPTMQGIREKAERGSCIANLRNLYAAAAGYVQQHGHWPQVDPGGLRTGKYARDWIAELEPFGIARKNWICPSMQRALGNPDYMLEKHTRIDYISTNFDDQPTTPYRWRTQPWFAEKGAVHGEGPLLICSDGNVHELPLTRSTPR
jgi:prepilin-type N-terminal cleavage/methylation domain-containing protein